MESLNRWLDDSVPTSEIQIDEYDLLHCERNRHGGGVACYVRNDLSYNAKSYFPKGIENIFFELLLPNTKPIVVGTTYHPPNQTNLMEIFTENLSKYPKLKRTLKQNVHHVFQKHFFFLFSFCPSVSNDVKNYFEFWTMLGPTWIACGSRSIIDHVLPHVLGRQKLPEQKQVVISESNCVLSKNMKLVLMKKLWVK